MNDFQLVNPENPDLCDPSKSQWYLDHALAGRIVQWALERYSKEDTLRVLEPSCGRGSIVRWLDANAHDVTGIDIDERNAKACQDTWTRQNFWCGDFTAMDAAGWAPFDLAVMNPPFEEGQTEEHVLQALKFAPRVVCHCPLTTLEGKDRREGLWSAAYLKRLVIHSSRPKYSGSRTGGQTAMCTIDVVRRPEGKLAMNGRVEASDVSVEWWS